MRRNLLIFGLGLLTTVAVSQTHPGAEHRAARVRHPQPTCEQKLEQSTYEQKIEQSLKSVDEVTQRGPFKPSWDSLKGYNAPEWFRDAKFGIFIHWGLYSVPAFANEWYSRNMYQPDMPEFKHHVERYGPQTKFGYKDFIPLFKAEKFDANSWAELFRKAGARYVIPVAEHHDGFAMYDTAFSEWSAAKMGPKRDVIGELSTAVRKQGLHFGLSSHRAEHYWFFDGALKFESDATDPRYAGLYGPPKPQGGDPDEAFLKDWLARSTELVDKYKPELVYFDWWIGQRSAFQPYVQKFVAYHYNRAAEQRRSVVQFYKEESMPEGTATYDVERGQLDKMRAEPWQTDTSISWKSWCHIENDDYKTPESLVQLLVDVVSKNGSLLLNVGPKADGTIPAQAETTLLTIGKWLSTNGEAIYGTRPWKTYGEGPTVITSGKMKEGENKPFTAEDIRFTTKDNALYAIAMLPPADGKLTIKTLAETPFGKHSEIKSVRILGWIGSVNWRRTAAGLIVEIPPMAVSRFPVAVKVVM
ncbi:MAG TPA: alpha-L-fucosidase [Terriglobales bacterium]|nr:alpha-L-fucosidase [Terriglobales bacterium]